MHLKNFTVKKIISGLEKKDFSSVEITKEYLELISKFNKKINCFISINEENALKEADNSDKNRALGNVEKMSGVPYANKDIFCTRGIKTTCGSKMLSEFKPPYNAEIVDRCKEHGLVMLGKTNMDEFAMGSSNETSYFGRTLNPWNLERVPGGSSGGSAAAVAAGLTPIATGSDTGGSIRQPASFCGISGLKPTYGRISRYGMIAFASSLDQGGPMAKTSEDIAIMMNVIAGFDKKDSTSIAASDEDFTRLLDKNCKGKKIGLPNEYFSNDISKDIANAFEESILIFERMGVQFKKISMPNLKHAIPAYYILAPAECSSNLARYDGVRFGHRAENATSLENFYEKTRSEGFGDEVKRRILVGTFALSAGYFDKYYQKAQRVRRLIKQDYLNAFQDVDFILGPTTPTPAFKFNKNENDPTNMYFEDIFTTPANLAGVPSLSFPAGLSNGLPIGMQITGNYFKEASMLAICHNFQKETDWHLKNASDWEY